MLFPPFFLHYTTLYLLSIITLDMSKYSLRAASMAVDFQSCLNDSPKVMLDY